ncbi:MAG: peptide ABC transporter substrate-binding protein, partial [Spirochaetes bacterium]|nr:peptide ABC transporter substrate-binding protein [Spirochaetota bacterium]
TGALLSAIPVPDPALRKKGKILMGDVPSPINPPSGCRFHPRCPQRMEICDKEIPVLKETSSGHSVSCHLY